MQYKVRKNVIKKENTYEILKAFAKEYRKMNGESLPLEIVIVGGGSIMLNYDFRDMTQDFDVMVNINSGIKDIVCKIAEEYNLEEDWLNTDFTKTRSFSQKLRQVSSHYCSFNHDSVEIRTVKDEYLIAMKMISARGYRNDLSDIVGILIHSHKENHPIVYSRIEKALSLLYGDIDIPEKILSSVKSFTEMDIDSLEKLYTQLNHEEDEIKKELILIERDYHDAIKEDTVDNIVEALRKKIRS